MDRLIDEGEMICWAAKWIGGDEVEFFSVYHNKPKAMVERIWTLLDEADIVIHYNGKKFDIPHIQREFLIHGLLPPAPFKQIDLLETVRRQFNFASNKFSHISSKLGLSGKNETGGFKLWVNCIEGDKDAWETMKAYNIQDVLLLEEAYEVLQPWIKSHPNMSSITTGEEACPKCGGTHLQARGYTVLRTGKFQRFHCEDCGAWSRGTKSVSRAGIVEE